ncbi:hypothetical protein STIAU_6609, partial [Stigmatella aurantiaca DW4/3-1]
MGRPVQRSTANA